MQKAMLLATTTAHVLGSVGSEPPVVFTVNYGAKLQMKNNGQLDIGVPPPGWGQPRYDCKEAAGKKDLFFYDAMEGDAGTSFAVDISCACEISPRESFNRKGFGHVRTDFEGLAKYCSAGTEASRVKFYVTWGECSETAFSCTGAGLATACSCSETVTPSHVDCVWPDPADGMDAAKEFLGYHYTKSHPNWDFGSVESSEYPWAGTLTTDGHSASDGYAGAVKWNDHFNPEHAKYDCNAR